MSQREKLQNLHAVSDSSKKRPKSIGPIPALYRTMATRLPELETWQLADAVRRAFIPILRKQSLKRDFNFIDQTRRAARSACRNIAEGFYRFRHPEFANLVNIAIGSLGELVDGTVEALELEYIDQTEYRHLNDVLDHAIASAVSLETYLLNTPTPPRRPQNHKPTLPPQTRPGPDANV